ncbi:preATP grasp domain-containing protein [Streptomyces sp. NPDC001514]
MEQHRLPLIVYANFFSDVTVDLAAHEILARWAEQAPRKIWLMRPGDVLVTPTPLSPGFLRYACGVLGMPPDSVTVITAPPVPGFPMAEAVRRAGLTDRLRALAAERPGAQLLPIALDTATVGLAGRLGTPVAPYGPSGVAACTLDVVYRLNTKSGFRAVAEEIGIRVPPGRICSGEQLGPTAAALLRRYERVVAKPDRSAGGHGLRFLSRTDATPTVSGHGPVGTWVVEECLGAVRSVSVQMEVLPDTGPHVVFSGEMRTERGSFTGYLSPLPDDLDAIVSELERWGSVMGAYLSTRGYSGPYAIDAVIDADGTLYATESNVRRTATTTPQAMVDRLARAAGVPCPAWLLVAGRSRSARTLAEALRLLHAECLAWDTGRGEGAVLYTDAPPDGRTWRYAVIGPDRARVTELTTALADVMALTV